MPKSYYQLSANGVLHRMEAGHAGEDASNPMDSTLISLDRYQLCGHCFGAKAEVGGELGGENDKVPAEDAPDAEATSKKRTRQVAHGVQSGE